MKMLTFEALDAGHGDALIIRFPSPDSLKYERVLVIDGGPSMTGQHYKEGFSPLETSILPRLTQIREERDKRPVEQDKQSGKPELLIDLVVCTHVHDDHIVGVMNLFAMLAKRKPNLPGADKLIVRQLWHNSFSAVLEGVDIVKATAAGIQPAAVGQGDKLTKFAIEAKIPVNKGIAGTLVAQGQVIDTFRPLRITILNPGAAELQELKELWKKESKVKSATGVVPQGLGDGAITFDEDSDAFNLSSITMLLEGFDRRILLTGDQLSEHIVDALEGLKDEHGNPLKEKGKPFHVDLIKVPHHGSKANVQKRFVDEVTADIYVFSANGKDQNPDPEVLELFLPVAQKREFTMAFTNRDMEYVPQTKNGKKVFPAFTDKTEVKTLIEALEHLSKDKNFKKNVNIEFRGAKNNKFAVKNEHALIYQI
jgi:hypothetical protein